MKKSTECAFWALFNHFYSGREELIERYLPSWHAPFNDLSTDRFTPAILFNPSLHLLKRIHYTWFFTFFNQMPSSLVPLMLSSMPSSHRLPIAKWISHPAKWMSLTPLSKLFCQKWIADGMEVYEKTPVELLPDSPFLFFCSWKKNELTLLIELLSVYDLAPLLPKLLDKSLLQLVNMALTKIQKTFLKTLLQQRRQLATLPLKFDKETTPQELSTILHRKGLIRFGTALFGQSPDLVWHISRILDQGRGAVVEKAYQNAVKSSIIDLIQKDLSDVVDYMANMKEAKA